LRGLRRLELTAGAPKYAATARGVWSSNHAIASYFGPGLVWSLHQPKRTVLQESARARVVARVS
jgi:hypothetical protein